MTRKQKELLDFIRAYQAEHDGVSPSFDEMAAATGNKSKSQVPFVLNALEQEGYIRRLRRRARAIEVIDSPHIPNQLSSFPTKDLVKEVSLRGLVVGHIHADGGSRKFVQIRP